jgi:hypothetical protein
MSKKPHGPPLQANKQRPRRVSICTNEQVIGVVALSSNNADKENQPSSCTPKPAFINPYATAKKAPPTRATATAAPRDEERSPVDAYFDSFMEYSLGGDEDPPASTLRPTTTAQRPPPPPPTAAKRAPTRPLTAARPPAMATTTVLKTAPPPPPPPTTLKRVPPPPPTAAATATTTTTLKRVPPCAPPPPHPFTTMAQVLADVVKASTVTTLKAAAPGADVVKASTTVKAAAPLAKEEDELCADLLPDIDVENAEFVQWARCNPTLYNDKSTTNLVRQSFGNTAKYTKQQKDSVSRLLMILSSHPEQRVRDLALPVIDQATGTTVPKFVHLTQNRKTTAGKVILNTVMVLFGLNVSLLDRGNGKMMDIHTMTREAIAKIQFMPSTMQTMYKQVFSYFKQNGICFQQKEFKGMQGSFHVSILCGLIHCTLYPHPLTSYWLCCSSINRPP